MRQKLLEALVESHFFVLDIHLGEIVFEKESRNLLRLVLVQFDSLLQFLSPVPFSITEHFEY